MNTRHLRAEALRGKRWRGYLRESTERQAERGTPLDRQRADILRAAHELGLVPTEPLWYARTGTGEQHSIELDRAIAEAGEYDVLMVFHSSRLARNTLESALVRKRFADAGIVLYFVAQHMISGARTTSLAENVQAAVDAEENETRRMWIAGGIRQRQISGRWAGAIPFGYGKRMANRPDGSRGWDGGLVINPDEAELVRDLFRSIAAGASVRNVTLTWNLAGRRRRNGQPWVRSGVTNMLRNPAYLGQLIRYREHHAKHYYDESDPGDGRRVIGADWEPLIDEATWQAANEAVGARRRERARAGPPFPLSGLLRCPACEGKMIGLTIRRRASSTRYYRCARGKETGLCRGRVIRAELAEESFAAWLGHFRPPADWRDHLSRIRLEDEDRAAGDRRAAIESQLTRLRDLYRWGDLTPEEYHRQVGELRGALAAVAPPNIGAVSKVAAGLEEFAESWMTAPAGVRIAVARLVAARGEVRAGLIEWLARPEVRPVLEWCAQAEAQRFSA